MVPYERSEKGLYHLCGTALFDHAVLELGGNYPTMDCLPHPSAVLTCVTIKNGKDNFFK